MVPIAEPPVWAHSLSGVEMAKFSSCLFFNPAGVCGEAFRDYASMLQIIHRK